MSAIQLSFSLRVSSGVKTVHLLGSWDNYVGQLPLSKDKSSSKSGSWKGTFRFQNSTLEAGQRYWYYYIIDGYHVAHNPSVTSTTEPTTGRELNILDVPSGKSEKSSSRQHKSSSSSKDHKPSSKDHKSSSKDHKSSSKDHKSSSKSSSSKSSSRHHSSSKDKDGHKSSRSRSPLTVDIPKGRPLSVSQIKAPKPMSPHATKHILDSDYYNNEELEELTARFGSADIDEEDFITNFSTSPVSSSGSSLSYRSDSSSPYSSLSGYSTPSSDCSSCTCQRYGITRRGERVMLDCGGSKCGYDDDSSDCSSYISEDENDEVHYSHSHSRRHGIIVT
ncbi:esdC-like protein [Metarhizium rileyi]|uniref:EsdC-like protein n=1 Tax=Metarhizium rileyi (strain RCEF 4871) TaxID=1649241 RepID=A0A162HRH2_METRR|nr:esdC-like protein [Metarhizium rileyi RCEF 4871]